MNGSNNSNANIDAERARIRRSLQQCEEQLEANQRNTRLTEQRIDGIRALIGQRQQSLGVLSSHWKGPAASRFLHESAEVTQGGCRAMQHEAELAYERLQQDKRQLNNQYDDIERAVLPVGSAAVGRKRVV